MLRQTFYISSDISRALKKKAYEHNTKISSLVEKALRRFLSVEGKKGQKRHSLQQYAGKIRSFKGVDPIRFQRKLRSEWGD